jgi:hypothetical protein
MVFYSLRTYDLNGSIMYCLVNRVYAVRDREINILERPNFFLRIHYVISKDG